MCRPRGLEIIELENFSHTFPPFVRFMNFEARHLSLDYIKAELRWYLHGDPRDLSIAKHARLWQSIADHSGKVNSNYGHYFFRRGQIQWVVNELVRDPDSRRATMVILQPEHMTLENKDVPCTYGMNFRIRNGKLNASVHMRSQDVMWGMGNDVPFFSVVQELVSLLLEVQMGQLHLAVDSLHVYAKHYDMINRIVHGESPFTTIEVPRIKTRMEAHYLIMDNPQEGYPFTQWLYGLTAEQWAGRRERFGDQR